MICPSYKILASAAFATDPPADLVSHLELPCPTCAPRWRLLGDLRDALLAGALDPVPRHLREAAEQIVRNPGPTLRSEGRELLSRLRVLVAELVEPVGRMQIQAVRRASARETRRLFRAEGCEVDLMLSSERALMGQLIAENEDIHGHAWCSISMTGRGNMQYRTALRETGEFAFEQVQPGLASMVLEWRDTRLMLPPFDIPG